MYTRRSSRKSVICILFSGLIVVMSLCELGLSSSTSPVMGKVGGRQKIAGAQNDLQLEDLAKFAVEQHNAQQNSSLVYVSLVSAEQQVVSGTMYYLELEATPPGEATKLFEAKVWVKPWENFQSLVEFKEKLSSGAQPHIEANPDGPSTDSKGDESGEPVSSNDKVVMEAAEQALKTLQQRSNSLVPYVLKQVISVHAQVSGKSTSYDLTFLVQRGSIVEQVKAEVVHTDAEAWTVKDVGVHP
eukprot:c13044_g1_i1 orf=64-792(+)